jgi:hypothetical protein
VLSAYYYAHVKRPPNSRCVCRSGLEDATEMTAHSRATAPPDLAGDPLLLFCFSLLYSVPQFLLQCIKYFLHLHGDQATTEVLSVRSVHRMALFHIGRDTFVALLVLILLHDAAF